MARYGVRDYLEIDADEARRQWRSVLERDATPDKRQEQFRPIEVVLCFALFRIVDPRRYGGRNIDRVPPVVRALAHTFRRSPGSLTNKMLNLSFDREHGGKAEPEVFLRLSVDPERFAHLYRTVVHAARAAGLGEEAVPDFLRGWDGVTLIGQDEIGSAEVDLALRERARDPATTRLREWFGEGQTERIVEQRVRLGQHRFAAAVLSAYGHACGFCGFSAIPLPARGMLVASHIKPWARCDSDRERLDPRNGIAACPLHDRAFDSGLLTVNGGLRIHRAPDLEARLRIDRVTDSFFGPTTLLPHLAECAEDARPAKRYLDYHRSLYSAAQ